MTRPKERGRCFACGKRLGMNPALIDTRDGQTAFVGSGCFKKIEAAGDKGWQPPRGGPRLYRIPPGLTQQQIAELHIKKRS